MPRTGLWLDDALRLPLRARRPHSLDGDPEDRVPVQLARPGRLGQQRLLPHPRRVLARLGPVLDYLEGKRREGGRRIINLVFRSAQMADRLIHLTRSDPVETRPSRSRLHLRARVAHLWRCTLDGSPHLW
jgi:hypothetical protein